MSSIDRVQPLAGPRTVEIEFAGRIVRGHVWPGDPNWVILVHEPGDDLDAWGDVPASISAESYSVLAIDLPGHGLSEDSWAPRRIAEVIHTLAEFAIGEGARKVFVVAANEIATAAILIHRVDALVALSPTPFPIPPSNRTPPALILVGGGDNTVVERANAFFRQTRGWAVVSSFGTEAQGTAIFQSSWSQHALEQTLAFFRDYRITPTG